MRHGLGQLVYSKANKIYKGYWSKNLRNGNGVIINKGRNTEFHGSFKDDKKEGFGLLIDKVGLTRRATPS